MRGEKIKVTLSLNVEALGLLDRLVTERKRGEFVSGLIVAYAARRETSASSVESLADTAQQKAVPSGGSVGIIEIAEQLRELASLLAKVNQPQPASLVTHPFLYRFIDGKCENPQRS